MSADKVGPPVETIVLAGVFFTLTVDRGANISDAGRDFFTALGAKSVDVDVFAPVPEAEAEPEEIPTMLAYRFRLFERGTSCARISVFSFPPAASDGVPSPGSSDAPFLPPAPLAVAGGKDANNDMFTLYNLLLE